MLQLIIWVAKFIQSAVSHNTLFLWFLLLLFIYGNDLWFSNVFMYLFFTETVKRGYRLDDDICPAFQPNFFGCSDTLLTIKL